MSLEQLTVKTPGKLMVAGEFAVLEPFHHLIVMAVDRFVYVTIEDSVNNSLNLEDYNLKRIPWIFDGDRLVVDSPDGRVSFVQEALYITYTYLKESNIFPSECTINVKSELTDETGIKYGLGSSAAVVTGVITAVLNKNLPKKPSKDLIFKLASIAHVNVQGNGSGADIAASTYGGMIHYSSFQAEWLKNAYAKCNSISSLIDEEWTYLSINHFEWPTDFHIRIGWTGRPASTGSLVKEVLKLKESNSEQYNDFLEKSKQAVDLISKGIDTENFLHFLDGIRHNRVALATVGKQANVDIETEKLYLLSQLAEDYDGAGKLSGAGGGDCGIAFLPTPDLGACLDEAWERHGIESLPINIYPFGSDLV